MQIISKLHVAVASTCKHCVSFYCFYFHLLFQLLFASLVCLVFCLFVCLSVCLLACFFGSCLLFLGRCGVYSLFRFVGGSAGAVVVTLDGSCFQTGRAGFGVLHQGQSY